MARVHGSDTQRLETRVAKVEAEVQRVHDEVEACSVLVLAIDAGASARADGASGGRKDVGGLSSTGALDQDSTVQGFQIEMTRLAARLEVLEQAFSNRSATMAKDVADAFFRLENEITEVWQNIRAQKDAYLPPLRELAREVQSGLQELQAQVTAVREELLNHPSLNPQALEALIEKMVGEVGRSTADLERRTDRLEHSLAHTEALEVGAKADRQRTAELERMIELLVQQRREDILATNMQLREIDTRLKAIHESEERERNWRSEAEGIRGDIEDLKIAKIPGLAQQASRASQLIAEGLQALRKEVVDIRSRCSQSGLQSTHVHGDADSYETSLEISRMKVEVEDLRQQVTKALIGGFDDRLVELRADFAAEVEAAVREIRETWADTSRRLAALEPWQHESAELHAEVRQIRLDRQEERARWGLMLQDEMVSLRAAITEGVEDRMAGFRRDLGVTPKAIQAGGFSDSKSESGVGAPIVLGRRVEWTLSAEQLRAAMKSRGGRPEPLVTGELEITGMRCKLKFYPAGSPLRTMDGHCSLYLLALVPVAVRFHLFAGKHHSPLLECTYDKKRDQGRHDLCRLEDALREDGGVTIGAEILDTKPLVAS